MNLIPLIPPWFGEDKGDVFYSKWPRALSGMHGVRQGFWCTRFIEDHSEGEEKGGWRNNEADAHQQVSVMAPAASSSEDSEGPGTCLKTIPLRAERWSVYTPTPIPQGLRAECGALIM